MDAQQTSTYLTTDELAARIKYDARTIRNRLKDAVLFEGVHYIRPFGGRKILFIWEAIERDMARPSISDATSMASGQAALGESQQSHMAGPPPSTTPRISNSRGRNTRMLIPMAAGGTCDV